MVARHEALLQIGGPDELVKWLEQSDDSTQDWDGCDRGDWLIWMAASEGVPLDALLEAAARCVRRAVARVPKTVRGIRSLFRKVCAADTSEELSELIDRCRQLELGPADNYRAPNVAGVREAVKAIGWLARGRDGVAAAEAVDWAERSNRGLHLGGILGVPPELVTRGMKGPLRLDIRNLDSGPGWQQVAFSVAAAAKAVETAATALAADDSPRALERAESHLADIVHEQLGALRG